MPSPPLGIGFFLLLFLTDLLNVFVSPTIPQCQRALVDFVVERARDALLLNSFDMLRALEPLVSPAFSSPQLIILGAVSSVVTMGHGPTAGSAGRESGWRGQGGGVSCYVKSDLLRAL